MKLRRANNPTAPVQNAKFVSWPIGERLLHVDVADSDGACFPLFSRDTADFCLVDADDEERRELAERGFQFVE
jgi:hypothetical protein